MSSCSRKTSTISSLKRKRCLSPYGTNRKGFQCDTIKGNKKKFFSTKKPSYKPFSSSDCFFVTQNHEVEMESND